MFLSVCGFAERPSIFSLVTPDDERDRKEKKGGSASQKIFIYIFFYAVLRAYTVLFRIVDADNLQCYLLKKTALVAYSLLLVYTALR